MPKNKPPAEFLRLLFARVAQLRKEADLSQAEVAHLMGIELGAYKTYEQRTAMPIHLLERFAVIVGRDIDYIVTGRSARDRLKTIVEKL